MDFNITARFDSNIEKFEKKLSKSFLEIEENLMTFIDMLNDPIMQNKKSEIAEVVSGHAASETNKLVCLYTESLNRLAREVTNEMASERRTG